MRKEIGIALWLYFLYSLAKITRTVYMKGLCHEDDKTLKYRSFNGILHVLGPAYQ